MLQLQRGDIFELKKGDKVCTDISEKFVYANSCSNDLTKHQIIIGETYKFDAKEYYDKEITQEIKNIQERINRVFDANIDRDEIQKFLIDKINKIQDETFETKCYEGLYLVTKARMDGGGKSHNDVYPDGYHVYAARINEVEYSKKLVLESFYCIDFYQTGCFTAMITRDIEVIDHYEAKEIIEWIKG